MGQICPDECVQSAIMINFNVWGCCTCANHAKHKHNIDYAFHCISDACEDCETFTLRLAIQKDPFFRI